MKRELIDRFGKLPKEAENMLVKIMLRVLAIKSGIQRLDLSFNQLTIVFSVKHVHDWSAAESVLKNRNLTYSVPRKNTVTVQLGKKQKSISKALVESKQILTELARNLCK
jgi:transcription-repair coupling factor (superfamily II helicase)